MRQRTLAAGTLAAALIGSAALASCSSSRTEVHSYQVTGAVSHLTVDAVAGTVRVTAGHGPVRVTETWRYFSRKPTTSHAVNGGTLRLTSDACGVHWTCTVDYDVRLPAGVSVDISSKAGLVRLTGMAGDVQVATTTGSVQATSLTSPHATVRDKAGLVRLEYAAAPSKVDVTDSAGGIQVRVPGGAAYAVQAHTKVGQTTIGVRQDPASPRTMTLADVVGKISVGVQ